MQIVHKEMVLAGVMEIADGVSFTPSETTFENFMKCNLGLFSCVKNNDMNQKKIVMSLFYC